MVKPHIEGSEGFFKLAAALREAEDKKLANLIRRSLRQAARPLGIEARDALAAAMPHRGGLSAVVGAARVGVGTATGGKRGTRVEVNVRAPGIDLTSMDAGNLRHPVFGRKVWVGQSVPSGHAQRAFNAGMPDVRENVRREVDRLLRDIASRGQG